MDSFMDKLAQRLTAQEMIKANTAADAEEMKKLKSQIKEYREILDQMQNLVAESVARIESAKVDEGEIYRLVDESIAKINEIQAGPQDNQQIQESMIQLKQSIVESMDQHVESVATKLDGINENVHKECVKVYRNVQAVVVEENNKQTESISVEMKRLKGKLSAIFGVSVAALIAAVGGIVFQVLVYLQVI